MDDEDVLLSRSSFSPIGTKLDEVMDSFRIDSETKSKLQAMAQEAGLPLAVFARIRLQAVAWGPEYVAMVHAEHIKRVLGSVG